MKSASARSRPNAANAASISARVLALNNRASSPRARAASLIAFDVCSVSVALPGLTSTAKRVALGNSSCISPKRLASISMAKKLTRPGKAGDKTKLSRVLGDTEDDRDRRCCSFGGERSLGTAGRRDYSHATLYQVRHHRRQAIIIALQPVVLDYDILTFGITSLAEPLAECGYTPR